MKRLYTYLVAAALTAGGVMQAQVAPKPQLTAQVYGYGNGFFDHDRDRDHDGWADGRRVADEFGFQDGLNAGHADFFNHHDFRPTHSGIYKHADRGYDRRFGDRDRYRDSYRIAYQRGYEQGYRERGGFYGRDRDHDHDRW